MRGKRETLAQIVDRLGLNRVGGRGQRTPRVVVLNYHRIADPETCPFDRHIVSATPEEFGRQLDYLKRHFRVLSLDETIELLSGASPDGGRCVHITFDDGYADNARVAAPMLAERGLPATFFLATGFIDSRRPAWWDEIAWLARTTEVPVIELPEFGFDMDLRESRGWAMRSAIELFKTLPRSDARRLVGLIAERSGLGRCPAAIAEPLWMTWDEARTLVPQGMAVGGHTVSHPVLSRLPLKDQREEIAGCRRRIVEELNMEPTAFSYPVGQPDSFTTATRRAVAEAGYTVAFSFYGGQGTVRHMDPFNVPRMSVERHDRGPVFRTRVAWPQLFGD